MTDELTPMLTQYLIGLCCLRNNPDAVDVILGDLVPDAAAGKARDVDVTVTVSKPGEGLLAFKAYEVKKEGKPLDVTTVEQLCIKLRDMPKVTHRAIVSASGYTDGAIAKADAHDVELLELKSWTRPLSELPNILPLTVSQFESNLLYWTDSRIQLYAPDGPKAFTYEDADPVFTSDKKTHKKYGSLGEFKNSLLLRSTEILWNIAPANWIIRTFPFTLGSDEAFLETPAWPHSHTLSVLDDEVYLKFPTQYAQVDSVTISGYLQWRKQVRIPEMKVVERVSDKQLFGGAVVAPYGPPGERMFAMTLAPNSRVTGIHDIDLKDKHKNAIRNLSLRLDS